VTTVNIDGKVWSRTYWEGGNVVFFICLERSRPKRISHNNTGGEVVGKKWGGERKHATHKKERFRVEERTKSFRGGGK